MEKIIYKLLSPVALMLLATPVKAAWPVAISDEFTVHQSYGSTKFDLLKNDIGSNLKVVNVNEWSEKGARIRLRTSRTASSFEGFVYGDVVYTPREGFTGKDGFWYAIEDDQGRKNSVRVVVNVKPSSLELPKPLQDFIDVPKNTSLRFDALENDLFSNKSASLFDSTFRGNIVNFTRRSAKGGRVEKVNVYNNETLFFGLLRNGYRLENTLKYQFKYTPPTGFVGIDSFTYAIKDAAPKYNGNEINDRVRWTKVNLNVSSNNARAEWPIASPDKANIVYAFNPRAYYDGDEIDVLKNDTGRDLVLKLSSAYSQKGSRVEVIPNYPNRPVIKYTLTGSLQSDDAIGTSFTDRVWYIVEDAYGRKNFSYLDVTVKIIEFG